MNKQKIETAPKDGTVINTDEGLCRYVSQKDWGSPVSDNKWLLCDSSGNLYSCSDYGPFICEPIVWFPAEPDPTYSFMLDLLGFLAEHDLQSMIWWRTDGSYAPVTFFMSANDLFAWGCSDCVKITPENLPILKQAVEDCLKIDPVIGAIYACILFACRVENVRPQGAAYPENKDLWPLFDACGPDREVGIDNPCKPGEYKRK